LSLFLGVVTYLFLNHIYAWEAREAAIALLIGGPWMGELRRRLG
jgi:hypothetical protein